MTTSIVFTFIADDKPGLVENLSNTVAAQGGNWLESRMSHLAGQFAGISRVQVSNDKAQALTQALLGLASDEFTIVVKTGKTTSSSPVQLRQLSIIGNDRPGIVLEVTTALASRRINVMDMCSNITSAPMTAEPLFEAEASIQVPEGFDVDELCEKLDEIANDLAIDISLND